MPPPIPSHTFSSALRGCGRLRDSHHLEKRQHSPAAREVQEQTGNIALVKPGMDG
jgi:hypothetical protein